MPDFSGKSGMRFFLAFLSFSGRIYYTDSRSGGEGLKRYIKARPAALLLFLALLFIPVSAEGREEEFEAPGLSEEIEALEEETPRAKEKEFYRLLNKDAALAGYHDGLAQSVYDPRQSGKVTPVRMQRSNTCWAFSSLAAGEQSLLQKAPGQDYMPDLSEAHLTYFFYHPVADPLGNTAGDGNYNISGEDFTAVGSNTVFSTFALANWVGAAAEETAPFSELSPETVYDGALAYADAAHLQNAYWINFKDMESVNVLKQMILQYGAAAVNFYWGVPYYNSGSFAYYSPLDEKRANNHSAVIVGWDDAFPKERFNASSRPPRDGAWIVKNSLGEGFGDGGYFYLSYEDSAVNPGNTSQNRARAYVFDFEPSDNYDCNYQYDGSAGAYNTIHPDSPLTRVGSGDCIANVFMVQGEEAGHTEVLKAVSFALFDTAVTYQIQIYKNLSDPCDPESGTAMLLSPVAGSTSYAGYYTAPLEIPVTLRGGDTFAVVIRLEKESGGPVNYFVDKSYQNGDWISFVNEVKEGQSFRSINGAWEDLALYGITARVKAFTDMGKNVPAKQIVPRGIEKDLEGNYFLSLWPEDTYALLADVLPSAADQTVYWETSDASVVTVDAAGNILPAAGGTAFITGHTSFGECTVKIKVTVLKRAAGLELSDTRLKLNPGDSALLSARLLPEDACPEEIVWEADGAAASVDASGAVTAACEGKSTIRAFLKRDPSIYSDCKVTVKKREKQKNKRPKPEDAGNIPSDIKSQEREEGAQAIRTEGAKTSDTYCEKAAFWAVLFFVGAGLCLYGRHGGKG